MYWIWYNTSCNEETINRKQLKKLYLRQGRAFFSLIATNKREG